MGNVAPPCPLPVVYQLICLDFIKVHAEEVARDFRTLEIDQAIFYTMTINDALEQGINPCIMARTLRDALGDPD